MQNILEIKNINLDVNLDIKIYDKYKYKYRDIKIQNIFFI